MRILIIVWLLTLLTACDDQTTNVNITLENHCTSVDERVALGVFIIDCAKAANPMSDEEGEDLVSQCENTGARALCPEHRHRTTTTMKGGRRVAYKFEELDNNGNVVTSPQK